MKQLIKSIVLLIVSLLDKLIPKNNNFVVYNSFPDFADNSFALFLHVHKHYPNKLNIWLVKDYNLDKYENILNFYEINTKNLKIIKRDSIKSIYYYVRSKYIFFTHGLFNGASISTNHCVVNLWHGMPLKTIGLLGNNTVTQKSNYGIATSDLYKDIISKSLDIDKVIVVGQPRNDLMFGKINYLDKLGINNILDNTVILWTPTYRQSIIGDIRIDGVVSKDFPVIKLEELSELNNFLISLNAIMIIKLHPMDILNNHEFENYSNIIIFNKYKFETLNCQLYSLLGNVDILLTDFSSIYIDYLLLNKPIGFVMSDYSEYSNSRGFVFDNPLEYMPGEKISSLLELKQFLQDVVVLNNDKYYHDRKNVNDILNQVKVNSSTKLLDSLNFE